MAEERPNNDVATDIFAELASENTILIEKSDLFSDENKNPVDLYKGKKQEKKLNEFGRSESYIENIQGASEVIREY